MVRSGLAAAGSLRYRDGQMNGGADDDDVEPTASRPWTLAAAMEPVPPLAPPPALPGHGVAVATPPRPHDGGGAPRTLISVVLLAAVVIVVVLVVVLGHHP
jgi:hypothetical protein